MTPPTTTAPARARARARAAVRRRGLAALAAATLVVGAMSGCVLAPAFDNFLRGDLRRVPMPTSAPSQPETPPGTVPETPPAVPETSPAGTGQPAP